jgi:transposase
MGIAIDQVSVYVAGLLVEVQLFIMRLSASGRAFPRAYLNEAQEVFLDGHVRAFEHFGGVPARIRYDNLKAAVSKVLKGRDRIESDRFVALRSHYGFDSFFCQPGVKGAHEKGGVEGEVGRSCCREQRSRVMRKRKRLRMRPGVRRGG